MYLAIGFHVEDAYTWSIGVDDISDPQAVADQLRAESEYAYPDQILIVENGNPGPNVIHHWNIYKGYQDKTA